VIVLQECGCTFMDWVDVAQDTDSWWANVSAVMDFRVT